jgi:3-oxoacyl-ACP reductase-like protein
VGGGEVSELFSDLMRTQYIVDEIGLKIPHSDFDRPKDYYNHCRERTYTGDEYADMCAFKDKSIMLYDRRWQSARAVIDLIAAEIDIDPENCGLFLYGLLQEKGEFVSPLVDKMRTWFDKSGDKVKLKRRIAELEAQLEALRAAIKS